MPIHPSVHYEKNKKNTDFIPILLPKDPFYLSISLKMLEKLINIY